MGCCSRWNGVGPRLIHANWPGRNREARVPHRADLDDMGSSPFRKVRHHLPWLAEQHHRPHQSIAKEDRHEDQEQQTTHDAHGQPLGKTPRPRNMNCRQDDDRHGEHSVQDPPHFVTHAQAPAQDRGDHQYHSQDGGQGPQSDAHGYAMTQAKDRHRVGSAPNQQKEMDYNQRHRGDAHSAMELEEHIEAEGA